MDVFGGTAEEGCFEDAVWDIEGFLVGGGGGWFEVEEGEVDVALEVRWEPWL